MVAGSEDDQLVLLAPGSLVDLRRLAVIFAMPDGAAPRVGVNARPGIIRRFEQFVF